MKKGFFQRYCPVCQRETEHEAKSLFEMNICRECGIGRFWRCEGAAGQMANNVIEEAVRLNPEIVS